MTDRTNARRDIELLHAAYVRATGFSLPLDMAREQMWWEVLRRGITPSDIELVVRRIRDGIRRQERNPGALKFRNFVGNADYLEEDVAEARSIARRTVVDPGRASVLQASGRPPATPPPPARRAGDVIRSVDSSQSRGNLGPLFSRLRSTIGS